MSFKTFYVFIWVMLFPLSVVAQLKMKSETPKEPEPLTLGQRFSFRTNSVDWVLMTPNLGIGFDLSSSPYNRLVLNLSGRLNWDTKPKTKSYNVYDISEGKLELRKYYHTRQRNSSYEGFQRYFSPERMNPRYWRAYYWGGYVAYTDFAFKFGRHGYAGNAVHGGVSFGMERSLFTYKESSLDLDVGASFGIAYWDGYKFMLDRERNTYIEEKQYKNIYPVLSEVRVSLVYRFGPSARNRYLFDQAKSIQRYERKMEKQKLKEEKELSEKEKRARKKAEKKARKDAKSAEKAARKEKRLNEKKAAYQKKMEDKYGDVSDVDVFIKEQEL